jgi:monoamine oxidase
MAADRVSRAGHEVVVLEARDRVGGRVWSQELVPGDPRTVVERGAEFVLDGYDQMRAVAGELGLRFADMGMSYYEREPRGGAAATHQDMARCAEVLASAAARARAGTPLSGVLGEWRGSAAALAAYVSRAEVTNGMPAGVLAAGAVTDVTAGWERRPCWRVAGGNQLVAQGLAGRLGSSVWLRSPVRSVLHDLDGVRVLTDDGEVCGDAVIVTVPMAVLRTLPFSPPLGSLRRAAWERAGLAHNAKLHVPLLPPAAGSAVARGVAPAGVPAVVPAVGPEVGPVGVSAVQSVPDRFWTWTATDGSGQVQPVLHAFGGTEAGLAALAVAEGPARWASVAAALRPELSLDLGRAMVTTWNDDPWTGESYAALTVTVAEGDDELIAAPIGRVHFAGEHTAGAWAGLMEGALRSGTRAADEVLAW